jgi:outer membrane receptor for ferrienterochelin and colicins
MKHLPAGTTLACLSAAALPFIPSFGRAAPALPENTAPQEVVVMAKRDFRPGALKEGIVKTEVIDADQVERLDAQNINQAIDFNPGISVQTECSICNVRNITLNNLPGRFTTLMIDGVPLFSSLSSAYGLDSVNVRGIQSIDIARGAGASLIAPEALAGVVNIVTKKPAQREAELSAESGKQGSRVLNAYFGDALNEVWSAAFTASYNKHDTVDNDHNGISEYTGYERTLAGIALFGDLPNDIHARLRVDYAHEIRGGGALGNDYRAIKDSTVGNPFNWSAGAHGSIDPAGWDAPDGSGFIPYEDGAGGFSEIIFTRRASVIGTLEGKLSDSVDWRAAAGYAHNTQDSFYEKSTYEGDGDQVYSELSAAVHKGRVTFTAGVNYRYEMLDSRGTTADGVVNDGLDDYTYRTPGVFVQYYNKLFQDRLETSASLRYDDHNVFGGIVLPRFNVLWHHSATLSSFFSAGRGYRAPTSFFEQDHGILDTSRIVREITNPETSDNFSYALNFARDRISATVSYNYNKIHHFALLDPSASDDAGNPVTLFTEAGKPVTVQGVDFSGSLQVTPGLVAALGAETFNYDFEPGTLAFSRPDWKFYASADWDRGSWDVFARVTVTGKQDLAKFYQYGDNQQYNLDGTPMLAESPVFATVDLKASYALGGNWKLYAGVDNLFNYLQTKREGPLWLDGAGNIDVTHIWGPLQGRYIYGGIRVSL